jgi:hypothetical protein
MSHAPTDDSRRTLLKTAAAGLAVCVTGAGTAFAATADADAPAEATYGKPGDFDFLVGEWKIQHRRLKTMGSDDWDVFEGEATCWTILGGVGSVEELRIPARNFSGMGLRLLDVEKRLWSDFWVNAKSGVLTTPGTTGVFVDGAGSFVADDVDGEKPIKVRGVWDRITPTSCRWHQALSYDDGKTWQGQWFMDWTRVS